MNENDLRDCFAMFALIGIISKIPLQEVDASEKREEYDKAAIGAYDYADAMLEARNPKEEMGIASVVKRTYKKKATS
jgi:hypothetical protein